MFLYTFHFSVTKHMKMISLSRRIHAKLAGTIYAKAGERKWGSNMKQSQMKETVSALEGGQGAISHMGVGDYAAADAGGGGYSIL